MLGEPHGRGIHLYALLHGSSSGFYTTLSSLWVLLFLCLSFPPKQGAHDAQPAVTAAGKHSASSPNFSKTYLQIFRFKFLLVATTDQHYSAVHVRALLFLYQSHRFQQKTEHHFSFSPLPPPGRNKHFVRNKQEDTFVQVLRPAASGGVCYAELLVPFSWEHHLVGR